MRRVLTFGCLCLLASAGPAAAEWHITPTIGLTFASNTSLVDIDHGTDRVHPNVGATISFLGAGVLGLEGVVVLTPGFYKGDEVFIESSRSLVVMGNVMLAAPRRWTEYNLRPFVSGGIGLLDASYQQRFEGLPPQTLKRPGFNIGGGAIGFFSPRTGVRFDFRYYSNLPGQRVGGLIPLTSDRVHLRYMTVSVGLVLRR
jgi:hypothetical protein